MSIARGTPGRPRQKYGEAVVAEGQDVQDGGPDEALPAAGKGQILGHQGLRQDSLVERVTKIVDYCDIGKSPLRARMRESVAQYSLPRSRCSIKRSKG